MTTSPNPDEGSADSIRSVSRALKVLRVMNTRPNWSIHDLYQLTALPKSTIFRILSTLQGEGYVHADSGAALYRVTRKVQELSSGYGEKSAFVEIASSVALRLTKRAKWPVAVGALDGDSIVVRYSGMPYSPLAAHSTTLGQRLGLCDTAMGRVYLAHCSPVEKELLLDMLRAGGTRFPKPSLLEPDLESIRRTGYALRPPNAQRRTASLALPIRAGADVLGVIAMTTFGPSMTATLVSECLPGLIDAVATIEASCAGRTDLLSMIVPPGGTFAVPG